MRSCERLVEGTKRKKELRIPDPKLLFLFGLRVLCGKDQSVYGSLIVVSEYGPTASVTELPITNFLLAVIAELFMP